MPDNTIQINVVAQNQASPVLQQVQRDLGQLQTQANKTTATPSWMGEANLSSTRSQIAGLTTGLSNMRAGLQATETAGAGAGAELVQIGMAAQGIQAGMAAAQGSVTGLLSSLGGFGALGIAGVIVGIGAAATQAAVQLGKLAEVNNEIEARFVAFAGGADRATETLRGMNRAAESGIDDEELMRLSARLLSSEVLNTSQQMEQATRAALMLGDATLSAEARIQAFTTVLMSGTTRGLRQFGLSADEVKAKTKEIQAANSSLTDQQARANAILEVAAAKVEQVAAAGGHATTSTQQLATAWAELHDVMAQPFAAPVETAQRGLAGQISGFAALIDALQGNRSGFASLTDYYRNKLKELQDLPAFDPRRLGIPILLGALRDTNTLLDQTRTKIATPLEQRIALDEAKLERWQQALADMTNGKVEVNTEDVARAEAEIARLRDELLNLRGTVQIDFSLGTTRLTGLAGLSGGAMYGFFGPGGAVSGPSPAMVPPQPSGLWRGGYLPGTGTQWVDPHEAARAAREAETRIAQDSADEAARKQQQAAEAFQRAVDSAGQKFKGNVVDALSTTKGNVAGLAPELAPGQPGYELAQLLKQGPLAPGLGGPTENIYRIEAVAFGGDQNEWAQRLGITQDYAKQIMTSIGMGQWTPEVMKWVDVAKLTELAQQPGAGQEAAQKLLEAAGMLNTGASDIKTSAKDMATGKLPAGAAPVAATNTINLSFASGAVQVISNNALEVGQGIVDAIFKALSTAENAIGMQAWNLAPGAR